MLVPVLVSRSCLVESTKGLNHLVSTSFVATFQDGTQKFLNRKDWQLVSITNKSDIGDVVLSKDNCALYWRDWSKNPIFGKWDKDYPLATVIPSEILDLYRWKK